MFGCCIAGRLLQTNLQQVDATHAFFELSNADAINHICVFLLGTVPFPENYGAAVHFFWPGKGFQLLGMLSNDKPSAIFRLRGTYTPGSAQSTAQSTFSSYGNDSTMSDGDSRPSQGVTAILGLAIEPLPALLAQIQSMPQHTPTAVVQAPATPTVLAERILKHLVNYLSGFASGSGLTPDVMIPMTVILKWYESFIAKLRAGGVGFLERTD